jgi:antitoxin ParD1/3/4
LFRILPGLPAVGKPAISFSPDGTGLHAEGLVVDFDGQWQGNFAKGKTSHDAVLAQWVQTETRMPRSTSVTLSDHFTRFVEEQVASGRYASASEVIREGLRLIEQRERRLGDLNAAIDTGLRSGVAEDFSWDAVRAEGRRIAGERAG